MNSRMACLPERAAWLWNCQPAARLGFGGGGDSVLGGGGWLTLTGPQTSIGTFAQL